MSTTTDELAPLRAQLEALVDRARIEELLGGYFLAFEERHLDEAWVDSTFTDDAVVDFPAGTHEGRDGLAEFHRRVADLWERTLHHTSNHVIRLDVDRAMVQAKLLATHVHRSDDPGAHLHIGGYVDGEAARTAAGWRLRHVRLRLVWTEGDAPARQ